MERKIKNCALCKEELKDEDIVVCHDVCAKQHVDCGIYHKKMLHDLERIGSTDQLSTEININFKDDVELFNTGYEAVAPNTSCANIEDEGEVDINFKDDVELFNTGYEAVAPNTSCANIEDGVDTIVKTENEMHTDNNAVEGIASGGANGDQDELHQNRGNVSAEVPRVSKPFMVHNNLNAAEVPIPQNQVQPNPQNAVNMADLRGRPIDENTSPAEAASYLAQRVLAGEHRSAWDRTFLQPTRNQEMQIQDFFRCFNNLNNQGPQTLNPVERIVHMTNSIAIANTMARRRERRRREENGDNNN